MKKKIRNRWCNYCKKETPHVVSGNNGNESGICQICGSSGMTKIQGFNANLM